MSWATARATKMGKFGHVMSLVEAGELELCRQPLVKKGVKSEDALRPAVLCPAPKHIPGGVG